MIFGVPVVAAALGAAGLAPFLVAAFVALVIPSASPTIATPVYILTGYGVIIHSFMSGALWGFATRATRPDLWLAAAVTPAILTFLSLFLGADRTLIFLIVAFPALLMFDYAFHRAGLTPGWWMRLRIPLTAVATTCLLIGKLTS